MWCIQHSFLPRLASHFTHTASKLSPSQFFSLDSQLNFSLYFVLTLLSSLFTFSTYLLLFFFSVSCSHPLLYHLNSTQLCILLRMYFYFPLTHSFSTSFPLTLFFFFHLPLGCIKGIFSLLFIYLISPRSTFFGIASDTARLFFTLSFSLYEYHNHFCLSSTIIPSFPY